MIVWFKFERWSVWIFLKIEKPLSESAFENGIASKPAISLNSLRNLVCPSRVFILPTFHQKDPALGFILPSAALYSIGVGGSAGPKILHEENLWHQNYPNLVEGIAWQV